MVIADDVAKATGWRLRKYPQMSCRDIPTPPIGMIVYCNGPGSNGEGCKAKKDFINQDGFNKSSWVETEEGHLCPRCQKKAKKSKE